MIINTLNVPRVVIYGILALAIAVQTCTLWYVHSHPESAADAIMSRSPAGYGLLLVLKVFKVDDESDLTRFGLSRDAVARACRFRADYGLRWAGVSAVLLVFIAGAHYAGFNRRS